MLMFNLQFYYVQAKDVQVNAVKWTAITRISGHFLP